MTRTPEISRKLVFTGSGPRSVPDDDVLYVYREATLARYCNITLCLSDGSEVSGRTLATAVDALQAKLDDLPLPPMAA
jgi:hypothetical protein